MEHISWWPEVMNGKVQVGGKGGGSQRATRGILAVMETF